MLTTTPQNSAEVLTQLQQAQSGNKGPGDYLTEANTTAGVPDAQKTVSGLRTSIDNTTKLLNQVAPSVMGRTQGSLVTNAQATKQISNEQAPISKNLTELGGQYTEAGQNLSQLKSQAAQEAQLGYQGQQDKQSYLQNLYNTMYGKEQDAATAAKTLAANAEDKRRYEENKAESIRQFNVQQAKKASSEASAAASSTPTKQQFLVSAFSGYDPSTHQNYTEREVIPALMANYGITKDEAAKLAYQYRKDVYNE